jgi:2-phospho-L-lactate transferase/gluconeogenesis factor (CofD/UPF0052 family)
MKTLALAGGVGGAKLAAGLQAALPGGDLAVVVNTADDFDLWGLHICPDIDTVMYTLGDFANPETGWGSRPTAKIPGSNSAIVTLQRISYAQTTFARASV